MAGPRQLRQVQALFGAPTDPQLTRGASRRLTLTLTLTLTVTLTPTLALHPNQVRRGDFTLMQRGVMSQFHGDAPAEHVSSHCRLKLPR